MAVGLRRAVEVNKEPPGRARSEFQLGYRPWNDALFDVVAVQMNYRGLVGSPLQRNYIALCDTDELHVRRNVTIFDAERIGNLGSMRERSGDDEVERKRACIAQDSKPTHLQYDVICCVD